MHKPNEVPIERIITEHYLFDLDQSIEKTAEILDKDEEYVRKIYDNYMRFISPTERKTK